MGCPCTSQAAFWYLQNVVAAPAPCSTTQRDALGMTPTWKKPWVKESAIYLNEVGHGTSFLLVEEDRGLQTSSSSSTESRS